jgi:hypothetical protein
MPNGKIKGELKIVQGLVFRSKERGQPRIVMHRGGLPAITKSVPLDGQICNAISTLRVILSHHVACEHVVCGVCAGMSCRITISNR